MNNPIPSLRQVQSTFHRIQGSAAVLATRVRGDVSRSVVRQIQEDANAGLAALHNLVGAMSETPVQQAEHVPDLERGAVEAPTDQPDITGMIRMLLEILGNIDYGSDDVSAHAHRAAIETVQDLAIALGVADSVQRHPPTTDEPTIETARSEMPTQPADDTDEEEWIDLMDSLSSTGAPLADEDLLSAIQAAVALQEMRDNAVISLECIHRRVGHCRLLFDQILREGERSGGDFLIGQFADIGRDLATVAQDECISLRRMLKDAGKEENHG